MASIYITETKNTFSPLTHKLPSPTPPNQQHTTDVINVKIPLGNCGSVA